jgi:hypothetical protein
MKNVLRTVALLLAYVITFQQLAHAAKPSRKLTALQLQADTPATAPVPAQIATAHTVFLANSGADANFPIDANKTYSAVYAALKAWGRYQLVDSPAAADLVLQLRDIAPITDVTGNRGGVYSVTSPAYQLTVLDPHSNLPLWTLTSPVNLAGRGQTLARWEALSVANLVSRIKVLAAQPLTPTETADLTTAPKHHGTVFGLLLIAGFVGVAAGGGILLHDKFDDAVAKQKQQQDAFCIANNIPLSECAGG